MPAGMLWQPLLCRGPLWPDESLPSYLLRLATANGYEPYSIFSRACQKSLSALGLRDHLDHPRHPATFDLLSALARNSPGELANATIHRFAQAPILAGLEEGSLYLSDGHQLRLLDKRSRTNKLPRGNLSSFCPDCLREAAYHRLSWLPLEVTVCLKHQCLLVSHCATCSALVDIGAIVEHRCGACGAELWEFLAHSIRDKPFELFAQRMVQAWWGLTTPPPSGSAWVMPAESAPVLYDVLEGLMESLRARREPTNSLHRTEQIPSSHVIQTTAFKGLVNWPQGFYDLLREYLLASHPIYSQLEPLFSTYLSSRWQFPEFAFVQDAFDRFLMQYSAVLDETVWFERLESRDALVSKLPYMTRRRAMQLLGTSGRNVETLAQKGIIGMRDSNAGLRLYLSQDVLALCPRWIQGFTLSEMARLLGVPPAVVEQLAEAGLLNARNAPTHNASNRLFCPPTLAGLWERGLANASELRSGTPEAEYCDLAAAIQALSTLGVCASLLIRKVLEGSPRVCVLLHYDPRFSQLCFLKDDLQQFADDFAHERGWVGREVIALRMGVKVWVVDRWLKSGLLQPVACYHPVPYFERLGVEAFVTGHVYTEEAARLLGVAEWKVSWWGQTGKLEPVSGPRIDGYRRNLYRREAVEHLRQAGGSNAS